MSTTKYLINSTLNIFGLRLLKKRTYEDLFTKLQELEDSNLKNQSRNEDLVAKLQEFEDSNLKNQSRNEDLVANPELIDDNKSDLERWLDETKLQELEDSNLKNKSSYNQDGLSSQHNNDFMSDPVFIKAYNRGVQAVGRDYNWHWRVHIGLWAARTAVNLDGDFVECGVNAGFLSSSIMYDLRWDSTGKTFYLLDTFNGLDSNYVSKEEVYDGIMKKNDDLIKNGVYITSVDKVKMNFKEWNNINIIEGSIPDTLPLIKSDKVSFLHIDMNCAPPEIASIDYLWNSLVKGAIVLLDDYAYNGYHHQKKAMDEFAKNKGISIASLPTGQGLIIKT